MMMMTKKYRLALFLCATISIILPAQNEASKEFAKISNAYKALKKVSFEVEVYGFQGMYDKQPELVGKGIAYKSEDINYSKFGGNEFIQQKNLTVLVDHSVKAMSCYQHPAGKKISMGSVTDITSALDSLWKNRNAVVEYKGVSNGFKYFTISTPGNDIVKSDLYFDTKSLMLQKVIYYYAAETEDVKPEFSSVILYYKNYNFSPAFSGISQSRFINKVAGGYSASPAYKNYEFEYFDMNKTN